jgi:transcriptional regulator with XRE-family HTH domain
MDQRPEQPPEGRLLADAAERHSLSVREAARRAGLSYGRWRQITSGYQNVSPGSYAPVRAPARTLARMAHVVGVTPGELTAAGREDAASALEEIRRREGANVLLPTAVVAPRERKLAALTLSAEDEAALPPYLATVNRDLYAAAGLQFGPGWEVSETPEVEEILAGIPGLLVFGSEHEARIWDFEGLATREKRRLIAALRMLGAKSQVPCQRDAMLTARTVTKASRSA